jgi:hypothetical protein
LESKAADAATAMIKSSLHGNRAIRDGYAMKSCRLGLLDIVMPALALALVFGKRGMATGATQNPSLEVFAFVPSANVSIADPEKPPLW